MNFPFSVPIVQVVNHLAVTAGIMINSELSAYMNYDLLTGSRTGSYTPSPGSQVPASIAIPSPYPRVNNHSGNGPGTRLGPSTYRLHCAECIPYIVIPWVHTVPIFHQNSALSPRFPRPRNCMELRDSDPSGRSPYPRHPALMEIGIPHRSGVYITEYITGETRYITMYDHDYRGSFNRPSCTYLSSNKLDIIP